MPLSFPNFRHLQQHRASSTSILFTACPLFIGLTQCPLDLLSQLRILYLPCAAFMPLPSCVGCVSTTSPLADTVSTASPPANCMSITAGSLEHQSLQYRATSNSVSNVIHYISTTPPPTTCVSSTRSISTTPFPTICVSTTHSCWPLLLASTTC